MRHLSAFVVFASLLLVLSGCPNTGGRMSTDSGPITGTDGGPGPDAPPGTDLGVCTPVGATETGDVACSNGIDDNCDGFADCDAFSCLGTTGCPLAENSNALCNDGQDNDADGNVDCDDFDCADRIVCAGESTDAACGDSVDNDGDGAVDCDDTDCQREGLSVCGVPTGSCTDGVDNDGDGFVDCLDNDCKILNPSCGDSPLEQSNAACSDGLDNDGDGAIDCADTRCQEEGIAVCDGATSVAVDPADYETASNAECSNGMNEDAATETTLFVDCADFSCNQNPDVTICPGESSNALCSDGIDNDSNGYADCADFSCSRNPFVTVCENSFERCGDGLDNDGNGYADCRDFSCNPPSGSPSPACY